MFAHRFVGSQTDLMGAMDQPIKDGIGHCGIADVVVPLLDGKLAGDEGGARAHAIVEDLEQIGSFARADGCDRKVVDHEQVHFGDGGKASAEAAVGMADAKLIE